MNKKILGIVAASVAALGSAIFAAPAHAVKQDVDVVVTIQPGMFLRTFKTIDLQVTQGDLSTNPRESDFNPVETTDGTGKLTVTPAPVIGTGDKTSITKSVDELYAVWSNSGKNVTITVTPVVNGAGGQTVLKNETEDSEILITSVTPKDKNATIPTSRVPRIGGIDLELDVSGASAGVHTGAKLTVEALAEDL